MLCGLVSIAILQASAIPIETVRYLSYRCDDARVGLRRVVGSSALFFQSKLSCDVDGSPNAYHPWDDNLSLDVIASAGGKRKGNLKFGPLEVLPSPEVVVYKHDLPYIQPDGEHRGFYVSETTFDNPGLPDTSPTRYLDARKIPYVVLPAGLVPEAAVGDLAIVYDPNSHRHVAAVFGDIGPSSESGEASLAAIQRLGLPATDGKSSPGESRDDLFYLVFPRTKFLLSIADAWPHSPSTIASLGETEFESWGGSARVEAILSQCGMGGSVSDTPQTQRMYDELARLRKERLITKFGFALPDRYGFDHNGRLPCAPEIQDACQSAIHLVNRKIAMLGGSPEDAGPLKRWNRHLTALNAIIHRFPLDARRNVAPPDCDGPRVFGTLNRIPIPPRALTK